MPAPIPKLNSLNIPELAGLPTPTVVLEGLSHVGTLVPTDKGAWSLEGRGLSVSQHPDDWARIARLPGETWHFPGGPRPFLDFHELTVEQHRAITGFGIESGYVVEAPAWEMTIWDDEWEQERTSVFLDTVLGGESAGGVVDVALGVCGHALDGCDAGLSMSGPVSRSVGSFGVSW